MRRFLLVLSVAALAGLAAWWSFSRAADSHAPTQPVESKSQPSAKDMASAIPNRTASSMAAAAKPSQAFFDPLEIAPCALTPISEQDVSSQVDGIFNEVLVDVGHQVRKGDLLGRLDDRQLRAQVDLLTIRAASESSLRVVTEPQAKKVSRLPAISTTPQPVRRSPGSMPRMRIGRVMPWHSYHAGRAAFARYALIRCTSASDTSKFA